MGDKLRSFIAIELDESAHRALDRVQEHLKTERAGRNVRWVNPTGIHLTMKFLGGVDPEILPSVQMAVATACEGIQPFELKLGGIGAFPNTRRPNVVWIGVGGDIETASRLANNMERECGKLGFERENRPFSPHLTLGRVKRSARPADQQLVGEMVANAKVGELSTLRVERVSLIKSELRPTGSVYTLLHAVELRLA